MKQIKKIKNSLLSRQITTAKLGLMTAKDLIKNRDKNSLKETLRGALENNIDKVVDELDVMKGSLMKMGQMLSLFGGSFLPKEVQSFLKKLENKSSYLEWSEISKQIPSHWPDEISIETQPLASASLGQVHLTKIEGSVYCMKIQYKGVRRAIDNDIKTLKYLIKLLGFIPKEIDLNHLFNEIKEMLLKETDYIQEAHNTQEFFQLLSPYPEYIVPRVLDQYSNDIILTTEYLEGVTLHEIEELKLTQDQKDQLGVEFMKLFLLELFIFEKVQTDAHFGNFLIIPGEKPKWGLIDFGATKVPPKKFIKNYQSLILSLKNKDQEKFFETVFSMGYLSRKKDSNQDLFWEYAQIIGSPFQEEVFDWGNTDIADQVFEYIPKLLKSISIGNPPADTFFIDKKLGGVFFVLQQLKAKFNVRKVLEDVIQMQKELPQ
ncbi:MAG: hypothetical protein CME62_06230 [Halobacteriovoraceae bacterium]|nr:hypothetical protein [Halobacteriovoraceae bacterium]|tara:strand:- start:4940 stop:6235 length:1296 start_codon:yes stop_codon:yes gene_type:complete